MIPSYFPATYSNIQLAAGYAPPDGVQVGVVLDGLPVDVSGHGYLAGSSPDGITKVEGVPTSLEVRVHYRPESGSVGDGALVKSTISNPDGTWLVEGLNPDLKFDVICRHEGYNDMILSNVSPALATGLAFSGSFATLDDQVEILLGVGPYQVDVVDGTPPSGVTFKAEGGYVVATGDPENWGQFTFTLRVIDSNGLSGVFESTLDVAEFDPHWDNVVALLHFDDPNDVVKTEKGATWYIHKVNNGFGEVTQNAAKFGAAGIKLNSPSSANYYYPFTAGIILTGEIFTAEVFCMPRRTASQIFTSFFNMGDGDQVLTFNANRQVLFHRGSNALGGALTSVGVNQYALDTYYHIAMTFDGTHIRVFVDGNKEMEIATAMGWTGQSTTRFGLGDTDIGSYNSSYRQATDAYFDELRITKGVARYTEDFDPPTEPFPNRGP